MTQNVYMENLEKKNHGSSQTPNKITIGERESTMGDSEATTLSTISSLACGYNKNTSYICVFVYVCVYNNN